MTPEGISLIMPTIDWGPTFQRCVQAAAASLGQADELFVVFDGSPPSPPPDWLIACEATLLQTPHRQGPAAARNLAASQALGPILLFVDADVELHPDAVDRVRASFLAHPGLAAVFGSYDANPPAPGLVSRFRNLLHHHTHSSHPGPASTFWAGCGAVRREPFLALGGFDARAYPQPSIEDIEFGLRLHGAGGTILLDPKIQGTHHKHWTLGLMLQTDIRNRAIPWSRLLLRGGKPSTILNVDPTARLSSLLALITLLSGAAILFFPWLWPLPLLSLGMMAILNRGFYRLCFQQGGCPLLLTGISLHGLYFLYSLLSFSLIFVEQRLVPQRDTLIKILQWTLLILLLGGTVLSLLTGLRDSFTHPAADLISRAREYAVFKEGLYPMGILVPHPVPEGFPYTVYPPYALPMFAVFFGIGGLAQGWAVVRILSLLSLGLIGWIGWRSLRFAGPAAACLGALGPAAISGNSYGLFQGQFSMVCMGLISLQWLLLQRQRPVAAAFCWAAAMLKPQIALTFALPLLKPPNRGGLLLGLSALLLLGGGALFYTHVAPLHYLSVWLEPKRLNFAHAGTINLMHLLGPGTAVLLIVLTLGVAVGFRQMASGKRVPFWRQGSAHAFIARAFDHGVPSLRLQGLCGILGCLMFYHHPYDNIMLYPAMLSIFALSLRKPREGWLMVLAVAMAITLWAPLHIVANNKMFQFISAGVWILVGLTLLLSTSHPQERRWSER